MIVRRVLVGIAVVLVVAGLSVAALVPITSERARRAIITELSARLDSTVELTTFDIRILPGLDATGSGLTIFHKNRRDVPPLITIRRFVVTGSFMGLLQGRARTIVVEGLDIEVPPHEPDRDVPEEPPTPRRAVPDFVIDELVAHDARVVILPRDRDRPPKVWAIHDLRMRSIGNRSMPFEAVLTNGIPPGEIQTTGNFGPWVGEEPGETPLDGSFVFEHADLGVFKGIEGTLSSRGTFSGQLSRIDVEGTTDTPDFMVELGGQRVPLQTRYRATVDGTDGDTILDEIDATFLNTSLVAKGRVAGTEGVEGRTVHLDVTIDKGRIEDILRLAIKTPRPMIGALSMTTVMIIPPGERDIVEKLQLNGRFQLSGARFTNVDVNRKIAELSRRGRGKGEGDAPDRVSSTFFGRFALANGRLTLPAVAFDVPGASVRLAGRYNLEAEDMEFRGRLFTDAKVSEMAGGIKGFLLKIVDPLFRRDGGGASIPIKVTGSRQDPSFGLDFGRVVSRGDRTDAPRPR